MTLAIEDRGGNAAKRATRPSPNPGSGPNPGLVSNAAPAARAERDLGQGQGQRQGRQSRGPTAAKSEAGRGDRRLGRPPLLDDPRARILHEAAKLFAQKGYEASSLAELAAAMRYSKGAIYNYFGTKQEIYDAIIIRTLDGLHQAGATAAAEGANPREKLRLFMIGHAQYLSRNYDSFVTMLVGFSGMANTTLKDDALRLRDAHEGVLRAILMEGIADGSFRGVDAAMTGRAVLSLLSWMARWFRPDGAKSAEEVADIYCDLLLGGLLPRDAQGGGIC